MGDHDAWSVRRADVGGPRRIVPPTAIVEIELDVDAAPSVARRREPRRRRRIALGVAASALVATVVAVWSRPRPEEGSGGRLPTEVHLQWSTELAVNQVAAVATDGDTVVALLNWDRQLVALDLSTGATRWTTEAPASQLAELEIVGEVVIALQAGGSELTAFDVGTGDFVWSRPADSAIVDPDRVLALRRDPSWGSVSRVERVDARSGRTSAVVEGSDLLVGADTITARSGDRLRAYDAGTLDQLAEIDVTDLEGRVLSTARTTDGFVVATSSRVGVADRAGALVSVVDLPGEDEDFPDVTLVPAGDDDLFAAVRVGSLSMVRAAGEEIEVLWHRPGHYAGATEAEGGLVAVLATPDAEDVRRRGSPGIPSIPDRRPPARSSMR